jgi:heme iron utilization protein
LAGNESEAITGSRRKNSQELSTLPGTPSRIARLPGTATMIDDPLFARVDQLLKTQLQGVLATQQHSQPYTSLMAFAHTADLRYLIIATLRDTQKHANLMRNAEVSFLVDNRTNAQIDYEQAIALSAIGRAQTISALDLDAMHALYVGKHPQLATFVDSAACALLRIEVGCYRLISKFQAVESLDIGAAAGSPRNAEPSGVVLHTGSPGEAGKPPSY